MHQADPCKIATDLLDSEAQHPAHKGRVKLFQAPQIESAPAFRQLKANISPAGSNFRCPPGLLFTRKIGAPCNGFRNLRVKGISQERKNLQTEKISPAKGFQIR